MRVTVSGGRYPKGAFFDADNVVGKAEECEDGTVRVRLDDRLHDDMWIEIVLRREEINGVMEQTVGRRRKHEI